MTESFPSTLTLSTPFDAQLSDPNSIEYHTLAELLCAQVTTTTIATTVITTTTTATRNLMSKCYDFENNENFSKQNSKSKQVEDILLSLRVSLKVIN